MINPLHFGLHWVINNFTMCFGRVFWGTITKAGSVQNITLPITLTTLIFGMCSQTNAGSTYHFYQPCINLWSPLSMSLYPTMASAGNATNVNIRYLCIGI